jgi:hypothetical protein
VLSAWIPSSRSKEVGRSCQRRALASRLREIERFHLERQCHVRTTRSRVEEGAHVPRKVAALDEEPSILDRLARLAREECMDRRRKAVRDRVSDDGVTIHCVDFDGGTKKTRHDTGEPLPTLPVAFHLICMPASRSVSLGARSITVHYSMRRTMSVPQAAAFGSFPFSFNDLCQAIGGTVSAARWPRSGKSRRPFPISGRKPPTRRNQWQ